MKEIGQWWVLKELIKYKDINNKKNKEKIREVILLKKRKFKK